MNLILFEQHEIKAHRLWLTGKRADHIRTILRLSPGDTLRLGMVNGRIGHGQILSMDSTGVEIAVQLERDPVPVPDVELILALPRPIMLQRILKQATVLGIRRFHLIRSARVEKSFFHSPVLQPEKIRTLLLEGLSQAVDTRLPEVHVYHRFKPFVQDEIPKLEGQGLIAHPGIADTLTHVFPKQANRQTLLLAIGPEGGWNEFELTCFYEQGFYGFSMGRRILHVDTAVVALLAQIQLLTNSVGQNADFCSKPGCCE